MVETPLAAPELSPRMRTVLWLAKAFVVAVILAPVWGPVVFQGVSTDSVGDAGELASEAGVHVFAFLGKGFLAILGLGGAALALGARRLGGSLADTASSAWRGDPGGRRLSGSCDED